MERTVGGQTVMSLASLCYNALRFSGVTRVARRVTNGGLVLCYHNVVSSDDGDTGSARGLGLHMPRATFERQMHWLREHYAVVPLDEFVGRLARGKPLRGVAAITFDDGYAGVFAYAWPLLRDLGLPATVFIVADAPGRQEGFWWDDPDVLRAYSRDREQRWLTVLQGDRAKILDAVAPGRAPLPASRFRRPASWNTIATAAASETGLDIGVHSVTHRSLPALDDAALSHEVFDSREVIRRRAGVMPLFFTYPYGHWNDRVRRAVQSAGYRGAFTLAAHKHSAGRDPWTIPRLNIPAHIGDAAFEAWTAGVSLRWRLSA
ncbi:MAG TPA: polysaccharide deacetylase family protein [Gemmatimonadales bacterium]|nr:polysaccharide deacetylase family protein [Gemmatimonadales bacterium]